MEVKLLFDFIKINELTSLMLHFLGQVMEDTDF